MAKTYIPTQVIEVHRLAVYLAKYQSVLRPAIVSIDPSAGALFDTMLAAVLAMDAVSGVLYPIGD